MIHINGITFWIELVGDYLLIKKGRKDIQWYVRALIMLAVANVSALATGKVDPITLEYWLYVSKCIAYGLALYPMFDPALNILRKKGLYYLGRKKWDLFMARFNPKVLLFARAVACVLLFLYSLN